MKSLETLEFELSTSLTHAESLFNKNMAEAERKYNELVSYYTSLKETMISAAEKRYSEAKKKLESKPIKVSLTPGKRGRPSKLEKEIQEAKQIG